MDILRCKSLLCEVTESLTHLRCIDCVYKPRCAMHAVWQPDFPTSGCRWEALAAFVATHTDHKGKTQQHPHVACPVSGMPTRYVGDPTTMQCTPCSIRREREKPAVAKHVAFEERTHTFRDNKIGMSANASTMWTYAQTIWKGTLRKVCLGNVFRNVRCVLLAKTVIYLTKKRAQSWWPWNTPSCGALTHAHWLEKCEYIVGKINMGSGLC